VENIITMIQESELSSFQDKNVPLTVFLTQDGIVHHEYTLDKEKL
jgi:hypothetical protein